MTVKTEGLLFLVLLFFASSVWALPEYTINEQKKCNYCHYSRRGGGPTNAIGRYYGKHHSFEGYFSKKKNVKKRRAPKVMPVPSPTPS